MEYYNFINLNNSMSLFKKKKILNRLLYDESELICCRSDSDMFSDDALKKYTTKCRRYQGI